LTMADRKRIGAVRKKLKDEYHAARKKGLKPNPIPTYFHDYKDKRAGILTHPTWLFAQASNNENFPVQRGKWVLQHLLAGTVPNVPVTVQAQVPEDEHKTLRNRFDVVKEKYCWECHRKMNPLGMPFENYNFLGNYRSEEVGKPIDASGDLSELDIKEFEGVKVKNAVELMHVLAKSDRVRQSMIRHAFRYWMGRNETLSDSPTLMAADKAYVESGGSFNAVLVSLLSSDSFLYRK